MPQCCGLFLQIHRSARGNAHCTNMHVLAKVDEPAVLATLVARVIVAGDLFNYDMKHNGLLISAAH